MYKDDLMKLLHQIKGNPLVIMSKDAEDNSHSPLYNVVEGFYYIPECSYCGDIIYKDDMDEDDFDNDEMEECIVLYPVN